MPIGGCASAKGGPTTRPTSSSWPGAGRPTGRTAICRSRTCRATESRAACGCRGPTSPAGRGRSPTGSATAATTARATPSPTRACTSSSVPGSRTSSRSGPDPRATPAARPGRRRGMRGAKPGLRVVDPRPGSGALQHPKGEGMSWLVGQSSELGSVVAKAVLMYATALVVLRLGERRTLAQWTIIDFATAVAMGAIIGRTAIAGTQSYLTGAAALVALVVAHRVASVLRFNPVFNKLVDHRLRVLVADGELRSAELRRCGLTDNDLFSQLRQRGFFDVTALRYVLYETKGSITVVPAELPDPDRAPLVRAGLAASAGYP